MGSDKKGEQPLSSYDLLKPFHASIASWRAEGVTFRQIADRLKSSAGLSVNFSAVDRYCRKENLYPEPRKKLPSFRENLPESIPEARPPPQRAGRQKAATHQPPAKPEPATKPESDVSAQHEVGEGVASDASTATAPNTAPKIAGANKSQVSDVRKTYSANRPPSEQATRTASESPSTAPSADNSQDHTDQLPLFESGATVSSRGSKRVPLAMEIADSLMGKSEATPTATAAPAVASQPAMPDEEPPEDSSAERTAQAPTSENPFYWDGWPELERFMNEQASKLQAVFNDPKEFREATERVVKRLEAASKLAPPAHQLGINDCIAGMKKLLSERQPPPPPLFVPLARVPLWTPDHELVNFGKGENRFTVADACEGVAIFGSTGSGKTSGSGQTFACSYLNAGFGGLVLTAKVDESELWQRYAERMGRTPQLCIVRPGGPFRFNFLDYQAKLPDAQGGSTENVVELLMAILEAYVKSKPRASEDGFWERTAKELLRNLVRVFRVAGVTLSLDQFSKFVAEAPKSLKQGQGGPLFSQLLNEARNRSRGTVNERMLDQSHHYWTHDFPDLNSRTRSIVITYLTSMIDLFFEPTIWELFCGETTITPEAVFDGAVIVVDLPVERFLSIGRLAAIIFKHFFQLAVGRRTDPNDSTRRPVFLWVDEAQNFTTEHDSVFQATARGAKAATVYLTQNISNYYAQAGGDTQRVDGFFSNLNTKIFHSNNDPATNRWAAEMIGKAMKYRPNVSYREEKQSGPFSFWKLPQRPQPSVSSSPEMDYEVQPADFGKLRTGGLHPDRPQDNLQVDAFLMKSGARFSNGKNFFKATFSQG